MKLTPDEITALIQSITLASFVSFVFSLILDQIGD